jgi:hypothetical protein
MNPNAVPKVPAVKVGLHRLDESNQVTAEAVQAMTHTINADADVLVIRTGRDNGVYQEDPVGVMTCDI